LGVEQVLEEGRRRWWMAGSVFSLLSHGGFTGFVFGGGGRRLSRGRRALGGGRRRQAVFEQLGDVVLDGFELV